MSLFTGTESKQNKLAGKVGFGFRSKAKGQAGKPSDGYIGWCLK